MYITPGLALSSSHMTSLRVKHEEKLTQYGLMSTRGLTSNLHVDLHFLVPRHHCHHDDPWEVEDQLSVILEESILGYETHKIEKGARGNFYSIVFNDIMGLEEETGRGVRVDDIKLAMMGHVKEGYKFNPASSLAHGDPGYNPCPSPDDKVHVLVCVHSANSREIKASTLQKMKEIREVASDLGIPQMAVVTKVDEACGETEKDLKDVYKSKHIKKKMTDFSSALGISMTCIFPVKNYSKEISNDGDVDTLILSVLRLIIDFGDDFIYKMFDQSQ
ncbi:hypothetical protein INR49_006711 [Caranx melampygus]|nr:hypothetical protein INR49_006711 [Caranx melampygus]